MKVQHHVLRDAAKFEKRTYQTHLFAFSLGDAICHDNRRDRHLLNPRISQET